MKLQSLGVTKRYNKEGYDDGQSQARRGECSHAMRRRLLLPVVIRIKTFSSHIRVSLDKGTFMYVRLSVFHKNHLFLHTCMLSIDIFITQF